MAGSRAMSFARRARAAARRRIKARIGDPDDLSIAPAASPNASVYAISDSELWPLRELYAGAGDLDPIGYATVRDFADSTETMPGLATASGDMKNAQRCWMVKAVLASVPNGGRLVEIGAGEPLVAGLLSRLGYEVVVVDPYDGSGNGPREYGRFTKAYPDLRFVRDQFPPAQALGGGFDCVYSISVLEHVPLEAVGGVIAGAAEVLRERGGCSIHAVDHVLAGWGADSHRAGLEQIVAASELDGEELARKIAEMELDPETYLVSAEAHNQWRGAVPYESYPMRRIGSVNLFRRY